MTTQWCHHVSFSLRVNYFTTSNLLPYRVLSFYVPCFNIKWVTVSENGNQSHYVWSVLKTLTEFGRSPRRCSLWNFLFFFGLFCFSLQKATLIQMLLWTKHFSLTEVVLSQDQWPGSRLVSQDVAALKNILDLQSFGIINHINAAPNLSIFSCFRFVWMRG